MKYFFLLLATISISDAFAQNLIRNGGFETDTNFWRGSATISPYDKKMGNGSGFIQQYVGQEWKGIDQIATVPKNVAAINFSGWLRPDGIAVGKETYNTGVYTVEFLDASDKSLGTKNIGSVSGTSAWTQFKNLVALPPNTSKIRIMLALAQTSGVLYFDEIRAMGITAEEYAKLTAPSESSIASKLFSNGNFENGLQYWTGNGKLSSDKKEGTSALEVSSENFDWVASDQSADIPQDAKSISVSGWLRAQNIRQGKETWNNGVFIIELTSDGTQKTMPDQLIGSVTKTTDWAFFERVIQIPAGTKKIRIMLALSQCQGTLLADDINVAFIK
ncbi:carbohydrate binding domain-containing protein [Flavobacterium silvaticum]|uniref:CBM-cenC domain-containing protein n=1 Tax=Flavobacterium silvaticum TaxID=1852020 RepID=A0A972JIP2_9FLAO|nr:carbohydrate binding domain-containing protein [Flavobacterium silvaticum]NMH27417.1 hypothetical protein [Flavobacterium silvaticum]